MDERDPADFSLSLSELTPEDRRHLQMFSSSHVQAVLADRQAACHQATAEEYLRHCHTDPGEQHKLHAACFNSTSEFFRDRWTFHLLERTVLPALAARGGARIWCAGCAAGQEALSLAIVLDELTAGHARRPTAIFATDLRPEQHARALAGRYPRSQFRHMTLGRMERWFRPEGDALQVVDELRSRVQYSIHDLLDETAFCPPESIYGDFDVISCMNLLLYYNASVQVRLLRNFRRILAADGLLVVAPSEVGIVNQSGLFVSHGDGPIFKIAPGERCPR